MTAGIVGLGLIGGSLAKAYHEAGERVLAHDIDRDVLSFAVISGAVDEALTDETMAECDVILQTFLNSPIFFFLLTYFFLETVFSQ